MLAPTSLRGPSHDRSWLAAARRSGDLDPDIISNIEIGGGRGRRGVATGPREERPDAPGVGRRALRAGRSRCAFSLSRPVGHVQLSPLSLGQQHLSLPRSPTYLVPCALVLPLQTAPLSLSSILHLHRSPTPWYASSLQPDLASPCLISPHFAGWHFL